MIWKPDTCDCIINLDTKEFIKRCNLHIKSNVDAVTLHNISFNPQITKEEFTLTKRKEITLNKKIEKERIKAISIIESKTL